MIRTNKLPKKSYQKRSFWELEIAILTNHISKYLAKFTLKNTFF